MDNLEASATSSCSDVLEALALTDHEGLYTSSQHRLDSSEPCRLAFEQDLEHCMDKDGNCSTARCDHFESCSEAFSHSKRKDIEHRWMLWLLALNSCNDSLAKAAQVLSKLIAT